MERCNRVVGGGCLGAACRVGAAESSATVIVMIAAATAPRFVAKGG